MRATQPRAAHGGRLVDLPPAEAASIAGGDNIFDQIIPTGTTELKLIEQVVNGFIAGFKAGYAG